MVTAEQTLIDNLQPISMKPLQVQFLFDFGSPNAYLCHKVLAEIETWAFEVVLRPWNEKW